MTDYKDVYMLTVVYLHEKYVNIEFETEADRKDFLKAINWDVCKVTLWELIREVPA